MPSSPISPVDGAMHASCWAAPRSLLRHGQTSQSPELAKVPSRSESHSGLRLASNAFQRTGKIMSQVAGGNGGWIGGDMGEGGGVMGGGSSGGGGSDGGGDGSDGDGDHGCGGGACGGGSA